MLRGHAILERVKNQWIEKHPLPPGLSDLQMDAWYGEFRLREFKGRDFVLTSDGADGTGGTKDDVEIGSFPR